MMADFPDPALVWRAVLGRLQLEIPKEHFDTFLLPCAGHSWDNNCLVVAAASSFAVSWLELPLHIAMAQEALAQTLGNDPASAGGVSLRYEAIPTAVQQSADTAQPADDRATVHAVSAPPASRRRPAPVPDDYDLGRAGTAGEGYDWAAVNAATCDPRYSFDNFIVGESNQLACHAAQTIAADGRGATPGYNPMLLYSGSGLGKTHLLHAIGNSALQQGRSVLYVTSEQFTNEFVSAATGQGNGRRAMREFRDRYRRVDLLLLDDVQFLAGKEQTQESLFHTFNDLHQAGAQIVFTSDRAPQSIAPLQDRLRSRFLWGLVADIQPPSLETRLAMLRAWAEHRGSSVPETVLELIAQRVSHNVRQLQGAFNRVAAMSRLTNATLTAESVSQQLDAILGPDPRRDLTPQQMLAQVASHYRIAEDQILGRGRTATVAEARQVAMYLLSTELNMTPTEIGRALAGRNHSTIIHGTNKIRNGITGDDRLRHAVNAVKAALSAQSTV